MQTKKVNRVGRVGKSRILFPKMRPDAGKESSGCCEGDSYQLLLRDKRQSA